MNGFESIEILNKEKLFDETWSIKCFIPFSSPFFKEHFKLYYLLPAVAEIDIVSKIAESILDKKFFVTGIKNTKFMKPIPPDTEIDIILNFAKPGVINFSINSENKETVSKGLITIKL